MGCTALGSSQGGELREVFALQRQEPAGMQDFAVFMAVISNPAFVILMPKLHTKINFKKNTTLF